MNCVITESYKWSSQCESAIAKIPTDKMSMRNYYTQQTADIESFAQLARSKLDVSERSKVTTLFTLKLGNYSVVKHIYESNINDTDNFYWKSQIR